MPVQTTYTHARANLAKLFDKVSDDNEIVIVNRRGGRDIAMIDAHELSSMLETIYLFSSPKNAERLNEAIEEAVSRKVKPQTVQSLREELGLVE